MVVTFPPGGSADAVVRLLVPRLNEKLGQQVVVDNRPGAGGNVGLALVAKAPADGYTLGLGAAGALTANMNLYPQMPFDPVKDFKPVGMVAATPFVIVGHPSIGARTLRELIALAKAQAGRAVDRPWRQRHRDAPVGGAVRADGRREAGRGALPRLGPGGARHHCRTDSAGAGRPAGLAAADPAGKLIAFAVTSAQRVPMLPDVPTVAEAGLPGYDSTGWFGVVAPAGTPAPIVARLNAEINAALGDEQIKAAMRNLGAEPAPASTEAFEAYIRSETKKWAKVIQTANIRLD
jgi:tripartite-type tricarboxylate transporter receptor subunit TctC